MTTQKPVKHRPNSVKRTHTHPDTHTHQSGSRLLHATPLQVMIWS